MREAEERAREAEAAEEMCAPVKVDNGGWDVDLVCCVRGFNL